MEKCKEKTPLMKISEVSRVSHKLMRSDSEKLGYNQTYRLIIFYLTHKNDGATQAEIVEYSKLSKPTISLTLQKMESEGLIYRKQDDVDLRNVRVFLTEEGRKTEKVFLQIGEDVENKVFSVLNEEEKEELNRILDKLLINIKELGDKI